MIVVKMDTGDVQVQADRWEHDEDGNMDCIKDDEVVATFRGGCWSAVYRSGAVTWPWRPSQPISLT